MRGTSYHYALRIRDAASRRIMNLNATQLVFACAVLAASGAVPQLAIAENAARPEAPPQAVEQLAEAGSAAPAAAAQGDAQPAAESASTPETGKSAAGSEPGTAGEPAAAAEETAQSGGEGAAAEPETAEEQPEPVTGAFGIPLNEPFDPCMVAKILGEEEKTYMGLDQVKHTGTLYRVEPKVPNKHFTSYSVATTEEGIIYAVRADYEPEEKASTCERVRKLAGLLEEKYGTPRGKGMLGEWHAFRDTSSSVYRGVRLYAPKCRHGKYWIFYSDDNAKATEPPTPAEPTETSGL
jgi:hypothetical protein